MNFRRDNQVLYPDWNLISEGDSTQAMDCPMGDGWATLKLVSPDAKTVKKLKCSTFSANTGCMIAEDFKTKSYAGEEGQCGKGRMPYPINKIAK